MEWFNQKTSIAGIQIPNWGNRSGCGHCNLAHLHTQALSGSSFKAWPLHHPNPATEVGTRPVPSCRSRCRCRRRPRNSKGPPTQAVYGDSDATRI